MERSGIDDGEQNRKDLVLRGGKLASISRVIVEGEKGALIYLFSILSLPTALPFEQRFWIGHLIHPILIDQEDVPR
jgi:hypothetical protein